jgi:hypothetical protein
VIGCDWLQQQRVCYSKELIDTNALVYKKMNLLARSLGLLQGGVGATAVESRKKWLKWWPFRRNYPSFASIFDSCGRNYPPVASTFDSCDVGDREVGENEADENPEEEQQRKKDKGIGLGYEA